MKAVSLSSATHPIIKHLARLKSDKTLRYATQKVLLEGFKIIQEVGIPLDILLVTDLSLIPKGVMAKEVYQVPLHLIEKVADAVAPEPILATISMPQEDLLVNKQRVLVLDNINDPGNLGTLVRTALALGWEGVYFLSNCSDPFGPKALRASKGAIFRLPYTMGEEKDWEELVGLGRFQVWAADPRGTSMDKIEQKGPQMLVLGNEAQGLSPLALKLGQKIAISQKGAMESLNVAVAGGILLHYLNKS